MDKQHLGLICYKYLLRESCDMRIQNLLSKINDRFNKTSVEILKQNQEFHLPCWQQQCWLHK